MAPCNLLRQSSVVEGGAAATGGVGGAGGVDGAETFFERSASNGDEPVRGGATEAVRGAADDGAGDMGDAV
jgi:hypothetical protein